MSKTFIEMQEMYKDVVKRFNRIELQDWKADGAMIELCKQVGELAKQEACFCSVEKLLSKIENLTRTTNQCKAWWCK